MEQICEAEVTRLMLESIEPTKAELKEKFATSASEVGVRYVAIDDLLPEPVAMAIADRSPDGTEMRLMKSFRELKYTSKAFEKFDPILKDIAFALQDQAVIDLIDHIAGIEEQMPDPLLYAGGLSAMGKGHYLSPYIDSAHADSRQYYRNLNLLFYVTPDWQLESGRNLELWNDDVTEKVTIHSKFNRLVLMKITPNSWHSVNKVQIPEIRKCVPNYYFSPHSPTGETYFNVTSFSASSGETALRLWSKVDNNIRQLARKLNPSGFGQVDVYKALRR